MSASSSIGSLAACAPNGSNLTASSAQSTSTSSPSRSAACEKIPQPDVGDFDVAPDAQRVDLCLPTFSNPTEITNPVFPVTLQESALLVGTVDDTPFRTEVTLLDHTRVSYSWAGMQVEVAVSQYVAFLGGPLDEVAYDLYAQDDEGNVWYFGEDVYNSARRRDRRHPRHLDRRHRRAGRDDHAGRTPAGAGLPTREHPRLGLRR